MFCDIFSCRKPETFVSCYCRLLQTVDVWNTGMWCGASRSGHKSCLTPSEHLKMPQIEIKILLTVETPCIEKIFNGNVGAEGLRISEAIPADLEYFSNLTHRLRSVKDGCKNNVLPVDEQFVKRLKPSGIPAQPHVGTSTSGTITFPFSSWLASGASRSCICTATASRTSPGRGDQYNT